MYLGGYSIDSNTGEEILHIFHHTELQEYRYSLTSKPGGVTMRRIIRLVNEYNQTGKKYTLSSRARLALMKRGILA